MRTTFHKMCATLGGLVLLLGAGIVTDSPLVIFVWLAVSASLLLAGRAFSFQQKH